jgi:ABC-type glycerol-3-phosphate transport system permease component
MSLLSTTVARRSREAKLYIALIYTLLVTGGVTMIYPFLIMISGSFKSEVDLRDWDVVPKYFYSDTVLFRKYAETKFNESVALYNSCSRQSEYAFTKVEPPPVVPEARTDDWHAFLQEARLPPTWVLLGHASSVNSRLFPGPRAGSGPRS